MSPVAFSKSFAHGIVAAVERMPRREVREDLPAREHRRLEQLGQPHGLGLRALAPDVVAEHQHRALRLAEAPGDRLDGLRARRSRPLDLVVGVFADLRLQPFAMEQLRADREVDRPRGRRGGLAQRADGGHADGRRIRVHLIGAARFLGDGAHRLGLAQPGKGREPAIVLQLGRPVPRDDQQRRAGHLRIEELPGELVRAAHDVGDDDADLAADAVVAVGHRGHQPLVLADHQAVVAVLGDGREEPGLRGAGLVNRYSTPASFKVWRRSIPPVPVMVLRMGSLAVVGAGRTTRGHYTPPLRPCQSGLPVGPVDSPCVDLEPPRSTTPVSAEAEVRLIRE